MDAPGPDPHRGAESSVTEPFFSHLTHLCSAAPLAAARGRLLVQVTSPADAAVLQVAHGGVPVLVARCTLPTPQALGLSDTHVLVAGGGEVVCVPLAPGGAADGGEGEVGPDGEAETCPPTTTTSLHAPGRVDAVVGDAGAVAVLADGVLTVHPLPQPPGGGGDGRRAVVTLPPPEALAANSAGGDPPPPTVTCAAAAGGGMLYYGTSTGELRAFCLASWLPAPLALPPAPAGVAHVAPDPTGTLVVVVNAAGGVALAVPAEGVLLPVAPPPPAPLAALWDSDDPHVFAVVGAGEAGAYAYAPLHVDGPHVQALGAAAVLPSGDLAVAPEGTPLPRGGRGVRAVGLHGGTLLCAAAGEGDADGDDGDGDASPVLLATTLVSHAALTGAPPPPPPSLHDDGAFGDDRRGGGRRLLTPSASHPEDTDPREHLRGVLAALLALRRTDAAWAAAEALGEPCGWAALGGRALAHLDTATAQAVYAGPLGDASMASAVGRIGEACEDAAAAAGHVAALFGDGDGALARLRASGRPAAAVGLLAGAGRWAAAGRLAEGLAPATVPALALRAGQALEAAGDPAGAVAVLEAGLARAGEPPLGGDDDDGGGGGGNCGSDPGGGVAAGLATALARCVLLAGDLRRGVALALAPGAPPGLPVACAEALLGAGVHPGTAGSLLAAAGQPDRAVPLLLAGGEYPAAVVLALGTGGAATGVGDGVDASPPPPPGVGAPALRAVAAAAQAAGDAPVAVAALMAAGDVGAAVGVLCRPGAPATDVDRGEGLATRSGDAAALAAVARCRAAGGDAPRAVALLLAAGDRDAAFAAAVEGGAVDAFVRGLAGASSSGSGIGIAEGGAVSLPAAVARLPPAEADRVCAAWEAAGRWEDAAGALEAAGRPDRAAAVLLGGRGGTPGDASGDAWVGRAIALAGRARARAATAVVERHLLDALTDGSRRDALLLRLRVAVGDAAGVSAAALSAARAAEAAGDPAGAAAALLGAVRALAAASPPMPPPRALYDALGHAHARALAPAAAGRGDHASAAGMLLRVVRGGGLGGLPPAAEVAALAATVLSCAASGRRRSAHELGCAVLQPARRGLLEPGVGRRVEDVVRRPSSDEADDPVAACPFCGALGSVWALVCGSGCECALPWCAASGARVTRVGCAACPTCGLPALAGALETAGCGLCGGAVPPGAGVRPGDPVRFLEWWVRDDSGSGGGGRLSGAG